MPRTDQIYPQQQQQQQQQGRDGYDEDWDDDVYYAAASRSGSSGSQKTSERDKHPGGGSRAERENDGKAGDEATMERRGGCERTAIKRHYMKVPNMRHPRAMRPSTENTFPVGIHHSADLMSSPRASTDTDLGDTPTSCSGNGSSVPLLGHLTPPSPPEQESGFGGGSGALGSARLPPAQAVAATYGHEASPDSASSLGRAVDEQCALPKPTTDCLARLRGSPRSPAKQARPPLDASPGLDRTVIFSAIGGRGNMTAQSSPAVAIAVTGGDGGVAGRKRKRAATAVAPGSSHRFGAVAWPALRGAAPPPPKAYRKNPEQRASAGLARERREQGVAVATASASRQGGADNHRRPHHTGQQQQQQQRRGEPSLSLGSSFSSSGRSGGGGINPSSGRSSVASSRRGEAVASRQVGGNGGTLKRPSLTDRPARWAGKGGNSAVRSPVRRAGAAIAPRGTDSNGKEHQHATGARHPSTSSKAPPGSRSLARSGVKGGQEGEGRTIKLTSVFQATANSSPRPRGAWGKDDHPGGHRVNHHAHLRGRQSGLSGGTPEASFDPTRMGPAPAARGVKVEEVEEVGSDEDDGFMGDGADVAHWPMRNGTSRRGNETGVRDSLEGTDDGVCEYDDLALGGEADGTGDNTSTGESGGQGDEMQADRSDRTGFSIGAVVSPGHGATGKARPDQACLDANGLREEGDSARLVDGDRAGAMARDAGKGDGPSSENGTDTQQQRRVAHPASSDMSLVGQLQAGGGLGAATAPETPRSERKGQQPPRKHQHHQQQQKGGQRNKSDDPDPPPRTPVRPPRPVSTSSFGRQPPHPPSAPAAASSSTRHGDWRPSFGSGGDGKVGRSPGTMQAPWAAFSTPLREGGPGWVPPSGSSATGSASVRRKRGGGAGNGPLGRLLQQVRARFDGDEARLLSGEFPFRNAPTPKTNTNADSKRAHPGGVAGTSGRDHGDPRTRCSVALDVSLMPTVPRQGTGGGGTSFGGGGNGDSGRGGDGLVRFLCFVHRVSDVSSGSSDSRESRAADARVVATSLERLRPVEGVCVDALFKQDTRRAVDLCPGSQLRIYDPCCVWDDASAEGRALLMCTQLCEPFPASLPPLPTPDWCINNSSGRLRGQVAMVARSVVE